MADNDDQPFQTADDLSDLVLLVDGGELNVHKFMLMLHSPVFKRMLSSDFAEKDARQIALPGKKREDLVEFLKQIYPVYTTTRINDDNVMGVLSLADEYQVDHVTTKCRKFIKRQTDKLGSLSVDQVLLYLGLSDRYHFDDVKGRLVQHAKNVVSAQDAAKSPFYHVVDAALMRDIMQSKVVSERAIHYVYKTSHEKLRQENILLTNKIKELQKVVARSQERPRTFTNSSNIIQWGRPIPNVTKTSNLNEQQLEQDKLRLTKENEQLKSRIGSLESQIKRLEYQMNRLKVHRCSLVSLICRKLPKGFLNKCLVFVAIIVLFILTFQFFIELSSSDAAAQVGVEAGHGGSGGESAVKALVLLPRYCDARP